MAWTLWTTDARAIVLRTDELNADERTTNNFQVAEPETRYDPIRLEAQLFQQPVKWLVRNVELFWPLGTFVAKVLFDIQVHDATEKFLCVIRGIGAHPHGSFFSIRESFEGTSSFCCDLVEVVLATTLLGERIHCCDSGAISRPLCLEQISCCHDLGDARCASIFPPLLSREQ